MHVTITKGHVMQCKAMNFNLTLFSFHDKAKHNTIQIDSYEADDYKKKKMLFLF